MKERLDLIETALLELGSEIFKFKQKLANLKDDHQRTNRLVARLNELIAEKGVISQEEAELIKVSGQPSLDELFEAQMIKDHSEKKIMH